MASLPDDTIQDAVNLLLKGSGLDQDVFKQGDHATIESLEADVDLLRSVLTLFKTGVVDWISRIHRRRNLLLPIYRLPPEVLGLIFEMVPGVGGTCAARYETLRNIAGVSFHWFSTILSTPRLWAFVDNNCHTALINVFIKRSKDVHLRVQLSGTGTQVLDSGILGFVMPHIDRWGFLEILSHEFVDLIQAMGDSPSMPQLQSLEVFGRYNGERVPDFIQRGPPHLKTLSIIPFSFPLGAPVFRSLRRLEFSAVTEGLRFSSRHWQALLCNSPQLEYIHAVTAPETVGHIEEPFQPFHVVLPNLQKFHLEALRPSAVGALLSSLHLPTRLKDLPCVKVEGVEFHFDRGVIRNGEVEALFPEAPQPQSLLWFIRQSIKWLEVCDTGGASITLRGGGKSDECYLDVQMFIHKDMPSIAFITLVSSSGLPILESLRLEGTPVFKFGNVIRALSCLPKLRKLDLIKPNGVYYGSIPNNLGDICDVLSNPINEGADAKARWPLPKLTDLGITSDGLEVVLPLIRARYGVGSLHRPTNYPMNLEFLRLKSLSRAIIPPFEILAVDQVLVTHLHDILDPMGTKLEITH